MVTICGYLDFFGHQQVMSKCDQEQSMKTIAELRQERRRPGRATVEYSSKESHQSNGVVCVFHYHLEGLMRTMRYDLMEKTGVNVTVKSLLAPWLVGRRGLPLMLTGTQLSRERCRAFFLWDHL